MPFTDEEACTHTALKGKKLTLRKRLLATAATAALVITGVAASPALAADNIKIDIVTINDFHGRIEANGASGGAAVLAGAVQEVRAANPNTIFAAAGDLIGATTFTSFIQRDEPTIDALNAAGLEVSAAGNHEFDEGWHDLRDRVVPRAEWEYISANLFLTETGEHALAPTWVKEVDGVNVGFIGAVTEDLDSLVSPAGIVDLEIRNIAETVNAAAAALTDGDPANGEADVVILLVHEGAETVEIGSITPGSPLGEIVYGLDGQVDAVVSAHTHLKYDHVISFDDNRDDLLVVSAGKYGEHYGLMSLEVSPDTRELVGITYENHALMEKAEPLYQAVPSVQDIVTEAAEKAEVLGAERVGMISADFNRAQQENGDENRGGESTIGNFVADVHQWAMGADIALMNPGGIRTDLTFATSPRGEGDGVVTYREAAEVQPFANTMMVVELTGAQLKNVLEEQWQPVGASRPFLKLGVSSGFTYTYDPAGAPGERISTMTLNGQAIDPLATYTVGANAFLAGGGDRFDTFAEGTNARDTGKIDLQSMVDWFKENEEASPDYAQRAVGVTLPAAGITEGLEATVELSSLAFTAGEPEPTLVTLSLDDEVIASADVNLDYVDATDERGRATLTFTLPEGSAGEQVLTFATLETGTEVSVTVNVAEHTNDGDTDAGAADTNTEGSSDAAGTDAGGDASGGDAGTSSDGVGVDADASAAAHGPQAGLPETGSDFPILPVAFAGLLLAAGVTTFLVRRKTAMK